mmetsp:Transcript_7970/g.9761  ORF Transcript_7970/g.9761 Transcript_7970/m.9761 type:complete len:341 (-) Transcript_7970:1651-2673(-)
MERPVVLPSIISLFILLRYHVTTCGAYSSPGAVLQPFVPRIIHRHSTTPSSSSSFHSPTNRLRTAPHAFVSTTRLQCAAWLPPCQIYDDDIFAIDHEREELEERSITYIGDIIQRELSLASEETNDDNDDDDDDTAASSSSSSSFAPQNEMAFRLAKGKFTHLTCSIAGEERLEHLVASSSSSDVNDENVVCGAIVALQSLLITGMQVGLKGSPEQQQRFFRHLSPSSSDDGRRRRPKTLRESMMEWSPPDDVKRLKHERDGTAAIELLAYLKRKRSAQGAFDLLVSLGVWKRHEDMALLRSGFPVRFSEEEELAAQEVRWKSRRTIPMKYSEYEKTCVV